jgi:hypothetical protein
MTIHRNIDPFVADKPGPESKEVKREYDWAFSVYDKLAKKYPNQWVAFAHRKVLAAGKNPRQVIIRARRQISLPEVPMLFIEGRAHVYLENTY